MSQPCRSVQWYAAYAQLPNITIQEVDLGEGENLCAEFREKHPTGQIPALEEGGFNLSESSAILKHLSRNDGEMQKNVATARQRARLDEYISQHHIKTRRISTDCFQVFIMSAPHRSDEILESTLTEIRPILQNIDTILATQKYIVEGDCLSLADFLCVPELDQLKVLDALNEFENIMAYLDRMNAVRGYAESYQRCKELISEITEEKRKRVESITARRTLLSDENSLVSVPSTKSLKRRIASGSDRLLRGHPVSCPCRSVQWYIKYSNSDVTIAPTKFLEGETQTPEFLAKHPSGEIPALEDGDFNLSESVAILQYLAVSDQEVNPLADDTLTKQDRARLRSYFAKHNAEVRKLSTECFGKVLFAAADDRPGVLQTAVTAITPILNRYDTLLSQGGYLLGPKLTLADFLFAPEVDQLTFLGLLEGYDSLQAYLQRLRETVPSYAENFAEAKEAVDAFIS